MHKAVAIRWIINIRRELRLKARLPIMPSASCRQVYAIHKATVAWQINTLCICENIFEHAAQTFSSANLQEAPPQTAVGSALEVASATAKRRQIETCSYLAADSRSNAANHNDRLLLLCLLNKSSSAPPQRGLWQTTGNFCKQLRQRYLRPIRLRRTTAQTNPEA